MWNDVSASLYQWESVIFQHVKYTELLAVGSMWTTIQIPQLQLFTFSDMRNAASSAKPSSSYIVTHTSTNKVRRNPKFHYRDKKGPKLVPTLNQMHSVHNLPHNFPNIHSNISYHQRLGLSNDLFPSRFPTTL